MTKEKPKRAFVTRSEPPNPLDFPVKDPLRETYEGRGQELPLTQKIGLAIGLAGAFFTFSAMIWGNRLNIFTLIVLVAAILGVCFFLFGTCSS